MLRLFVLFSTQITKKKSDKDWVSKIGFVSKESLTTYFLIFNIGPRAFIALWLIYNDTNIFDDACA
jgi:hypothetical protein